MVKLDLKDSIVQMSDASTTNQQDSCHSLLADSPPPQADTSKPIRMLTVSFTNTYAYPVGIILANIVWDHPKNCCM